MKIEELYTVFNTARSAHGKTEEDGMRAVLDHLATSEVPSAMSLFQELDHNHCTSVAAMERVRLACVSPLVAKVKVLEAKLEEVKKLPERWRLEMGTDDEPSVTNCYLELEQALSTPAPQVPEIPKDTIIVKPPADRKAPPAIVAQMSAMNAHEKASEQVNYLVADNLSFAGHPELSPVSGGKWAAEKAAHAKGLKIEQRKSLDDQAWSAWHPKQGQLWHEDGNYEYRIAPGQEADPYAELKAAAEAGKWIQLNSPTFGWMEPKKGPYYDFVHPAERYRVLTTTVHDGKTYFKHTPGDEMPVGEDVEVCVLFADKGNNSNHKQKDASSYCWDDLNGLPGEIIGYYPTSLAEALGNVEKPQAEQDKPDALAAFPLQDGERLLRKGESPIMGDSYFHNDAWHPFIDFRETYIFAKTKRPDPKPNDLTALEKINEQLRADILKHIETIGGMAKEIARLKMRVKDLEDELVLHAHPKITHLENRLAALTPRSVAVKPTKEDAGVEGNVILFSSTSSGAAFVKWDALGAPGQLDKQWTHWLPGSLARLAPELLPKVESGEEIERKAFEEWSLAQWPHSKMERTPTGYSHEAFDQLWKGWQARAGKEAA